MTKRITNIAAIMMLMVSLMAGTALAQKNGGGKPGPAGVYSGVESMPGTIGIASETRYGNSFVLRSFGERDNLQLTVSLDYSMNSFNPDELIVTGGTWSLVVIRNKEYVGTLYGEIQTGGISLDSDKKGNSISKQVQINLKANGGMGIFEGKAGRDIVGVYDMTTDLRSGVTSGNANFTF